MSHYNRGDLTQFRNTNRIYELYDEFLDAIRETGATPVIISDIPECGKPACLAQNLDNVSACYCDFSRAYSEFWMTALSSAAQRNNVAFINVTDLFCYDSFCPPIVANYRVMRDLDHVSDQYAGFLTPYFIEKLKKADVPL